MCSISCKQMWPGPSNLHLHNPMLQKLPLVGWFLEFTDLFGKDI